MPENEDNGSGMTSVDANLEICPVLGDEVQPPVRDLEEVMRRAEHHIAAGRHCWIGVYRAGGALASALKWDGMTCAWRTSGPPSDDVEPRR